MRLPSLFRLQMILTITVLLAACSDSGQWHGKDISGLMPELTFELTNDQGEAVTAEQYQDQIRLLFFGFTSCPDVCPATLAKLNKAIRAMPEPLRTDVTALFVSVDPQRDTPEKIAAYVNFFGERTVGLTGDEPALRKLAKRYRTTFGYDKPDERGNYAVSHSSAVYVFDRQGKARLLFQSDLSADQIAEDLTQLARGAG
ncbi:MAG TPA: cytochrome c oxidase assembly protein [Marinobacter sp.]|nr:SCO family protein [Marinobacter sp.]HCW89122.1 cytochrome c oxidase assembly protein [Marinobacter sp.]